MEFATLDQVLAHEFVGNHAADHEAFAAINRFILRDDVSREDKKRAVEHSSIEGMGFEDFRCTDADLDETIAAARQG